MECMICKEQVSDPRPVKADGRRICCCDKPGCQEDFTDFLDNGVVKVEKCETGGKN